ncbi:MAG: PAS domain S-box protein, partial [Candidatus Omnitrophica bacterium]|nr:PAS domain S-box protein [Candidatus Omnitrophota bacterium]
PVLTAKGERLIAWRNVVLKNPDGTIAGTLSEGRDITDEREAENRMIESERRFRLLFESAPVGYVACFYDGRIFDVNQFFISMTGFKKEQLAGKNFKSIVFSTDRKQFDLLFDALKRNTLNVSEFRIMKKDGSSIDVYCTARIAGKQDRMIQIILYDITHRRVMDKLNKAQGKIGSILNKTLDSSNIALKVASAIKESFGFESVAVLFKDDSKKQHLAKGFQHYIRDCLAGKSGKESKDLILRAKVDGKEKFFTCFPLKTEEAIIGVLLCVDTKESKFSPEIVGFLENTAKVISIGFQRIKSFKKLQTTIKNFETFIGSTKDMAFIKDSKFRYVYVNPEYAKFFDKSTEEVLGKSDFDLMETSTARQCRRTDKQALKNNRLVINEEMANNRIYETRKFPVRLESGEIGVGAFIRDITEEKEHRQKLSNLMWMYTILYQVNQAIIQAKNPSGLFKKICEIACNEGKFVLAWMCTVDYEKKSVVPVAGYGKTQYYKNIKISFDPQSPEGKGPTARAIRTGRICVCNDFFADRRMQPWWQEAKKCGFCSSAAVPIRSAGKVTAALNLYSGQRKFFSDDIKKLLVEIASDIGLCIEKLNAEEIRKKAEQCLRENEKHLAGIFENLPVPAIEIDLSELRSSLDSIKKSKKQDFKTYITENRQYLRDHVRILNINKRVFELFAIRNIDKLIELLKENLFTPEIIEQFYTMQKLKQLETKIKTKGGIEKDVILNFNTVSVNENDWSRVIISLVDITDRIYMEKNIRATLSRFRGVFDTFSAGIGILDLEGRPIVLNNRVCEMLGYSHEELMKMKLMDVIHPEELDSVKSMYEKLRNGEITHYETERRYVRKDGSIIYAYVSGELIFDEILNEKCIIAIVIDITKQKEYLNRFMRIRNALQAAIACNEIFENAKDEKAMLSSICDELSKVHPGFVFVILKNISGFEIVTYSKENIEFFSELREMFLEKSRMCPTVESLFKKKHIILNNIESSNYFDEWKSLVAKYGFKSMFALPVVDENVSIGCLSIFSPEKNRFIDDEENSIINGIAENVGRCITVLRTKRERDASISELQKSYARLQDAIEGISLSIAKIIETRDPYTAGHQVRVAKLAVAIATEIGLPENIIRGIYFAGILHDIGKINVPVEILVKPGRLTEDEFAIIKLHSMYGYEILSKIPFPWDIAVIVRQHHERLDGSGYPEGLLEKDILLEAKIIAVADVVEAMAFDRPYRTAFGIDFALNEIKQKSGILFDPFVVDICVSLFKEKGFVFD